MPKPDLATIPQWYHKYVTLVSQEDVASALLANTKTAVSFFESIAAEKWQHRYAQGKWSIKEMMQHLIDAERIFCYRALCIARGEIASLPGFDENEYAAASKADIRTGNELLSEFQVVRHSTEKLFASFDEEQLSASGTANNTSVTVNGIGFIIPGHVQHHLNILTERYL